MINTPQVISTLADVMNFMAVYAGGAVPAESDDEYQSWRRWIRVKQEEYAKRGFWRRLLQRAEITLTGETTLLPENFHKSNGLYVLDVAGVDWMEPDNKDGIYVFVEMINDSSDDNLGRWQMRFNTPVDETEAIIWYFANPPVPEASTDKILLPGDMVAYGALAEYFGATNRAGSQDKADQDAENRFISYLSLEMIPPKNELLVFSNSGGTKKNYNAKARSYYYRSDRHTQV